MQTHCPACGSERIIPKVRVVDKDRGSTSGVLQVALDQRPDALIFKRRVYGELWAEICGKCGYTALFASNPEVLYDAYLTARALGDIQGPEVRDWDDLGWACPQCGKRVADSMDVCWSCGTHRSTAGDHGEP